MNLEREKLVLDLLEEIQREYSRLVNDDSKIDNLREKDFVTEIDEEIRNQIEKFFRSQPGKFKLETEEKINFEKNPEKPDYTVIIDEMDATHHLIEQEGPFGTVFGIAEGSNPKFSDILASGFIDLRNNKKYWALRNKGAFLSHKGRKEKIETSNKMNFGEGLETKVLLQQGFLAQRPEIAKEAWKRWCNDYGSQGKHYAMIASGRRDVYITGGHSNIGAKPSNTAEEAAGMYLIIKEAGGPVLNWEGESIQDTRIGMAAGKNHDIVAAATQDLAESVINSTINNQK
jgi:fructose-1,6-bisphosphatase/inositol monophosphatase family enzyme